MRIVLAPEGTRGDVYPLLDLGATLLSRGHLVRVCAPSGFESVARERGFEFVPTGNDVHELMYEAAKDLTRGGLRLALRAHRLASSLLDRQLEALPDAASGADWIIGAGVQLGGPTAAELHGVPYQYVAYCPVALPSEEHAPFFCSGARWPRAVNRVAWSAVRTTYDRLLGSRLSRSRAALGLGPVRDVFEHLMSSQPVLAADRELAPLPGEAPEGSLQIPCLHAWDPEPLPPKLETFLDAGEPPVYFGFGSMTDADPERTTRILVDVATRLGVRALISTGWAGYGRGPLPSHVETVDSVSHAALFGRVALVVHHGGAGTTTTAARAGVPQLVVSHVADQPWWGRRVHELGLGPPPLARARLNRGRLEERVRASVDNEWIAARAHELGERLRASLAEASPDRWLDV